MDTGGWVDGKTENRLYVGNLDLRINEYGKTELASCYYLHSKDQNFVQYLISFTSSQSCVDQNVFSIWENHIRRLPLAHTRAKVRRTTRLCFHSIQPYRVSTQEAELAKEQMHGRLACGRPLVVRLASEKNLEDSSHDHSKRSLPEANRTRFVTGSSSGQMSRDEKVAAIKNKLKALEEDEKQDSKKQKR